jgi:hypothetical protein
MGQGSPLSLLQHFNTSQTAEVGVTTDPKSLMLSYLENAILDNISVKSIKRKLPRADLNQWNVFFHFIFFVLKKFIIVILSTVAFIPLRYLDIQNRMRKIADFLFHKETESY